MTVRLRTFVVSLLAALLLAQSAVAAAHCLWQARRAAIGLVVPICTPEGLTHAQGDANGTPPAHAEPCACIVCHLLPQAELPWPPLMPEPSWHVAAAPAAPLPVPRFRAADRALTGWPRGPPLA